MDELSYLVSRNMHNKLNGIFAQYFETFNLTLSS